MDYTTGFIFHESDGILEGYLQLDVILTDAPSGRYFDTQRVTLPLAGVHAVVPETVEHPWRGRSVERLGPGRIRLQAHNGEVDEVFTFGGTAEFGVDSLVTICRLTSPAPFYHHGLDPGLVSYHLVDELEALMAHRLGEYAGSTSGFAERLNAVDPYSLFIAAFAELNQRVNHLSGLDSDPSLHAVADLVGRTIHALQRSGDWPATPPKLSELL
jgi:hypothetical protein